MRLCLFLSFASGAVAQENGCGGMAQQNHGLINRVLQRFVRDRFGADVWRQIADDLGLVPPRFEPMLHYDVALTQRVLSEMQQISGKPREDLLGCIGAYLGGHPHMIAFQRLLRFGADDFDGFLRSLEDVPDRVALSIPGLNLPQIEVQRSHDVIRVVCVGQWPEYALALRGVVQAMAPQYGRHAMVEVVPVMQSGCAASVSRTDLLVRSQSCGGAGGVTAFPGRIYRHQGLAQRRPDQLPSVRRGASR
ncbi:Heme NO binding protein [Thalassovita mediterranea]|uniref:Heme NO binding protein n=2 Tax=Thalassovita mediterranea TaxID=340021 RepID=A0A0P1GNT4_9RHOB|nr:Heme NO binding protein [Thalassovita mediterranea]SIS28085.1 Haem-NO-binding [Thalassovita mediterranea]